MADVRALLKAKRQEARIEHPFAVYSSTGQLRCTICSAAIKHASAWEGHLGSKAHRTNALRLKEEARKKEEEEARQLQREERDRGKRKAEDHAADGNGKRARLDDDSTSDDEDEAEGPASTRVSGSAGGFPADFFSDPTRAPPPLSPDPSDDEDEGNAAKPAAAVDAEWEQFQQFLAAPEPSMISHDVYQQATIIAEPQLVNNANEGFPPQEGEAAEEAEEEEDEETIRKRKAQEERELIMDRLLDEEQAQEEADLRAQALKDRLSALKQKREAARMAKGKKAS